MTRVFNCVTRSIAQRNLLIHTKKFYSEQGEKKKVGVVLAGCGFLDGTEIHEASATAVHLTRLNLEPVFYSVSGSQSDVINHSTARPMQETRSVSVESSRISRGNIFPLTDLTVSKAHAVIFPGGFGVAKTLSTYAACGVSCTINEEVLRIMKEFHKAKKPMGFLCIAAILPAREFPNVKVTLGKKGNIKKWPHKEAIDHAIEMGADVQPREVDEFLFDKQHFIFTTPAYMYNGTFYQIFEGIGHTIDALYSVMH